MTIQAGGHVIDHRWVAVIGGFVVLSAADLGLTLRLLDHGATELNPIMAWLFDAGWGWAAAFKASITLGVATGLWLGRDHRLVRRTGIGFLLLFGVLVAYQLVDLAAV